jgi:hypothetical protein
VGEVAKTNKPEPVSSVTAAAKFAEDGVPKNVATLFHLMLLEELRQALKKECGPQP